MCGGDHSIFHCENKCGVCQGDKRECSCSAQPPPSKKKKSTKQKQSSDADLRKQLANLTKEHERVGLAFINLQEQNEELARDLEERDKDLEELSNIVATKDEALKNMERRLQEAKRVVRELRAEVQSLRAERQQPDSQQHPPPHQQTDTSRVHAHSLTNIHERYEKVLQVINENGCSMANAFRLAQCPRSTLRDFVAIAELKIVDQREHEVVIRDHTGSVKELEARCRRRLGRYLPVLANLRREGKLLPLKFDDRFYE